MAQAILKTDLIFPELSYKVIGALFEVSKYLGYGLREKEYQKALATIFDKLGIKYEREYKVPIILHGESIAFRYLDFIIDDKVALEIKKGSYFSRVDINQLFSYLKLAKLKLGILARFTRDSVKYKRIVNLY